MLINCHSWSTVVTTYLQEFPDITMENKKQLEELLESDDELPDAYEDIPEVPAYQNDNRFDAIEFPWIENKIFSMQNVSAPKISIQNSSKHEQNKKPNNDIIIIKGFLPKQDVYCLKCIADNSSDDIFVWFLNFLIHKDMQADYPFLKSCLIPDAIRQESYKSYKIHPKSKSTYNIIFAK
ncbi:uncharacterized protein LOC126374917 [Pectinophora gossypiella]|uniref:Uncharacterized protein n=2 Tax=Pectinophora gossypiella TaxID=13191 RepID=A0A1E1WEF6_PECGO|nr:uncharacterized protein LOC126374917 [Pectinophora gossypiella]